MAGDQSSLGNFSLSLNTHPLSGYGDTAIKYCTIPHTKSARPHGMGDSLSCDSIEGEQALTLDKWCDVCKVNQPIGAVQSSLRLSSLLSCNSRNTSDDRLISPDYKLILPRNVVQTASLLPDQLHSDFSASPFQSNYTLDRWGLPMDQLAILNYLCYPISRQSACYEHLVPRDIRQVNSPTTRHDE